MVLKRHRVNRLFHNTTYDGELTASATSFMVGVESIPYVWAPTLTRNAPRDIYCALEISLPMSTDMERVFVKYGRSEMHVWRVRRSIAVLL